MANETTVANETIVTKPPVLDETFSDKVDALNHLISHQNAAIDLLAADKRTELVTNVQEAAILAKNGELLEVMDYGDDIHPEWLDGETHYNPAMNLCHESDELLEGGETIHGCFFEWDKVLPFGTQFSHQRAITAPMYKVASALPAGQYNFTLASGQKLNFTLPTGGAAVGYWLGYTGSKIAIYDTNGRYVNKVTAAVSATASGTALGAAPKLAAGDYYFTFAANWGTHVVANDVVSFTLPNDVEFGERICGCYHAPDQVKTNWKVYIVTDSGKTIGNAVATGSSTSGTNLGVMQGQARTASGDYFLNCIQEVAYGYNRWMFSALRQYLNSDAVADAWWEAFDALDVRPDYLASKPGFLAGYAEDVKKYFKPIRVVTVAQNADGNVEDITYDRVFLSSLEQMYCVPQFSGKEGAYWEYYKRLLGRTTPAPTSQTYPRLIKYALNAVTSAQFCFRRSANRNYANDVWLSNASGRVGTTYASNAGRCAPSVFLSD